MMGHEEQEELVRRVLELCRRGLKRRVEEIVDREDILVDDHDDDDVTPLQAAAAGGHLDLVKYLLEKGADVQLCNQYGWTPVMHASYHGHLQVLQCLLENGADFKHTTYLGASALTLAARRGNMAIVKFLLKKQVDLKPKFGADLDLTPIMAAAMHSHDSICRVLLTAGAEPNDCIRSTGLTTLMIATLFSKVSTVEILLETGADPNLTSEKGHTALDFALMSNKEEIGVLLKSKTDQNKDQVKKPSLTVLEAIRQGEFLHAKELIASGPESVDSVDEMSGRTPLMEAAAAGRFDLVEVLVGKKAQINIQEKDTGFTALMLALQYRKPIIARYLIASGADVNVQNFDGKTALDVATMADGDKDLLSELAKRSVKQRVKESAREVSERKSSGTLGVRRIFFVPIWAKRLVSGFKNFYGNRSGFLRRSAAQKSPYEISFSNNDANLFLEPPNLNIEFINFEQMLEMEFDIAKKQRTEDSGLGVPVAVVPPLFQRTHAGAEKETVPLDCKTEDVVIPEQTGLSGQNSALRVVPRLDLTFGSDHPRSKPDLPSWESSSSSQAVYRSLAHRNAVRMGPGVPKQLKLNKRCFDHRGLSEDKVNIRTVQLSGHHGGNPGSSLPTLNSGTLNRRRKPSPLSGKNQGYTSLLRQRPGIRPLSRPHSYHDGSQGQQNPVQHKEGSGKKIWLSPGAGRPHSFHDTEADPCWDLPVTPTRKSFGFFTGGPALSNMVESPLSKHSSTPLLNAGGSGSSSVSGASANRFGNTGSSSVGSRFHFTDISGEKLAEEQLQEVLKQLCLDSYASIFEEQEVDMETFVTLTDADLLELGIEKQESRTEILVAAQELNRRIIHPTEKTNTEEENNS